MISEMIRVDAVDGAVNVAVADAAYDAVANAVYVAVDDAVYDAVAVAVYDAVYGDIHGR